MYHFASAALMTPVKSQDSFAASFPSSGAELPAAGYGIMEEPTPAPLLPEDKAAKAKACCFGQKGRKEKQRTYPLHYSRRSVPPKRQKREPKGNLSLRPPMKIPMNLEK